MKAKKSANNKVQNRGLHGKKHDVPCSNRVHPDVILDADEAFKNILGRLANLESEVASLKEENKRLKMRNEYLEARHRQDTATIRKLKTEVASLKARLSKLEKPKKDSHNSSVPPSKEDVASSEDRKKTKSLRKPSGMKPGGQPGHKGSTLQKSEDVDEFVEMPLDECPDCGEDLSGIEGVEKMARQVIDINFSAPTITQFSILEKFCPKCGHIVCSEFPEDVNGDVSYGPNVQALVVYLCEEHAVSYQPIKTLMYDMFGINISEGTIDNNASERAVRPAKTKQKVAGLFRTFSGAEAYSIMHSIIDTAKKQMISPFNELQLIAQLKPSLLQL